MSEQLPGYDTWKLASPPERAFPRGVEDIIGTLYYCLDDDGELCLFAYADDFYEDSEPPCEYDCEGFATGGGTEVRIHLTCYYPDGRRASAWDHSERVDDLEAGEADYGWMIPSDELVAQFTLDKANKV